MKYKIIKVLNNNAVLSLDDQNEEIIVKGKGLAFKKQIGDILDNNLIDKIFILGNPNVKRKYQELIISIPNDICDVCAELIEFIQGKIETKLNDNIYVTLTDHIANLIERIQMGISFNNSLLWDVKRIYKKEYAISVEVVEKLKEAFHINIDEDEACFITLHIVNAEMDGNIHDTYEITSMIEDVYDIVVSYFNLKTDKEGINYTRFIMHLRVFFERIFNKEHIQNEKSEELLNTLKEKYSKQYECVMQIMKYVTNRYDEIVDGEVLYLLVHVIKLTEQ